MITIKSTEEVGKMRKAGALLHQVHEHLRTLIEPGITTAYLDRVAEKLIRDAGAILPLRDIRVFLLRCARRWMMRLCTASRRTSP